MASQPPPKLTIAELPFHERPALELLALDVDRDEPLRDYAGFGWARVARVWLDDGAGQRPIDDAVVLALHSADDGEPLRDDIELEFELPGEPEPDGGGRAVGVLASQFLERWLPRLPAAPAIVLALCNPYGARLRRPAGATAPIHHALGNVESWLDLDEAGDHIRLAADGWTEVPR